MTTSTFSERLLAWYDQHGRKDLPWQINASPYHVWLSEVMLQQTQVATVIPYYHRFINRFPDVTALANANIDDVLSLWSGLGYYARGRNLHKAAVQMQQLHNAKVPEDFQDLLDLPGIGRSTAGAIMALAYQQQFPILDGNVKRVLARYDAIKIWPGEKQAEAAMWHRAEQLLPTERIANYIQAQMDLGATLCTRSRPDCKNCPLQTDCQAFATGEPTLFPVRKAKKQQPTRQTNWFVYINQDKYILLEQRPQSGIWGGLWSFPEGQTAEAAEHILPIKNITFKSTTPEIKHVFSHFKLNIQPYIFTADPIDMVAENKQHIWVKIDQALTLGLPAPVKQLIEFLSSTERML
ncbi:A/G-specific adenine glycosylase [Methylophaga sp.]|uniref:A/G-specific adenine glycosylase n=1 Tax=Methylophaga sp. TaxID=2024840 RepID=UPI003A92B043